MESNKSTKKITKINGDKESTSSSKTFVASEESKGKATNFRIIAIISWLLAIGFEIGAIYFLRKLPINMTWLIVMIVADLIFVVIGSLLWKKENRLDPASKQNKFKFFVQNQLGLIISLIAFLPIVVPAVIIAPGLITAPDFIVTLPTFRG